MKNNKKILMLLSNAFDPDPRVYKEAKSLIKFGYEVKIIGWDRELKYKERENIQGILVERIRYKAGYGSMALFIKLPIFWIKLFFKAWKEDFDFIHCHDFDTLVVGVLLKIFKKKKFIYDAHELFLGYTENKIINKLIFLLERIILPKVDFLIYTNEERLKVFLRNLPRKTKEKIIKKTIIIHNYPISGIKRFDKNYNKIIFQYAGGIKKDRNIFNIVKAFSEIKEKNILFYIYGNTNNNYGRKIKDYIKKTNIKNIIIKDYTPLKKLMKFMTKTNVGFVPVAKTSLNNMIPEPTKLYENFATGNISIAEDLPYLKKIIGKNELVFFCDFSKTKEIKKIIELIIKMPKEELKRMTESCYKKYMTKYNWENEENKLIKIYKRMEA